MGKPVQIDFVAQIAQGGFAERVAERLNRGILREAFVVSVQDVAAAFSCSENLVYAWLDEGRLIGLNYGSKTGSECDRKAWRIEKSAAIALAKQMENGC